MATDDARESKKLVRMYSFDVEERLPPGNDAHVLGQVLGEDRGDLQDLIAPWRKFFDPWQPAEDRNPISKVVAVESAKVREKWFVFQENCPKEERLDLQNTEPTVECVTNLVNEKIRAWQSKREMGRRGKAMSFFHRFCGTLDSHSSLLKLLPEGSHYASIFTGTLHAIIKASVNHERIAEGLSEALWLISEHITWCNSELELFQTRAMLERVADLYAHIFLFLSGAMDWIMEKRHRRMLDSFNENFRKRFDDEVTAIKDKAEHIRSLAGQSSRAELRATRLIVEELERDLRLGLEGEARRQAEMTHFREEIKKEFSQERQQMREGQRQLGACLNLMLQEGAMRSLQANRMIYIPLQLSDPLQLAFTAAHPAQVTQWTSEEVSLNSKYLEEFFHRDRVRPACDPLNPVMVSREALARLSEWTESATSWVLWLEGSHTMTDDFENPITAIAARYIDLADRSGVQIISYFCELRPNEPTRPSNTTGETAALFSLVYALLRQMIELLPPRFDTHLDLSESRFRRLNLEFDSWPDMLSATRDMLELMPEPVFCVINGFHWLDDRSTDDSLEEFLQVLRTEKLKVLFTTTGRSACLQDGLSSAETVPVEILHTRDIIAYSAFHS